MLAFLYLCVCAITGMVLVAICIPDVRRLYLACAPSVKAIENIPSTLFVVSAGTVTGLMCVPFVNYYVILGLSYFVASEKLCMKIGLMVTAALFLWLVLTCLITVNRRRIKEEELIKETGEEPASKLPAYVNKPSNTLFYSLIILLVTVVSAFLMFYTYRIDRNYLLNGYSTFSDLSPHTAMVSSFGKGFNFPTEYMHFSGDGIKYHFMFYFLAGMLEYLGFPIDYALNIPSIISMVCALVLLGLLASLLSGRRLAFALSPVFVFLRSSLNVFIRISNSLTSGKSLAETFNEIFSNQTWYGVTPYDEWGVWAINVYPNQRHLMLGIAITLICVILFIPFVRRLCISTMSAGSFSGAVKAILFSRNAWLPRKEDPLSAGTLALFTCILVIVMPYFHGSCLIALLLVLFGMALVSESRLLHLMVAACAVISSFIQTLAFSGGAQNVLALKYQPGFLLSENSQPVTANVLLSWGSYLMTVTGATLVVAFTCTLVLFFHDIVKKKPVYRFFLFLAFLNPIIFAFTFQVTLEMLANHKFIQVSLILIDAFVAIFMANLLVVPGRKKTVAVLAADVDIDADTEDEQNEEEEEEDSADEKEALEANIEKAAKDGELPPVIPDEAEDDKEKNKEVHFGDSDDEPFEVLTDDDSEPEEIVTDDEEKSEEKSEEKTEDKDEDSRLLSKIPDERTVSMRPGSMAIAEDAAKAEEKEETKEASAETDDADDSDDAEVAFVDEKKDEDKKETEEAKENSEFPSERTVAMRPGSAAIAEDASKTDKDEKTEEAENKEEAQAESDESSDKTEKASEPEKEEAEPDKEEEKSEELEELPFEVLDDEDEEKDSKELAEKNSDEDEKKEVSESSEEEDDTEDEDEEDEDDGDMVLEHQAVETKAKGLPGPVWVICEIFGVAAALILLVALTGTGISEWATYININNTPMAVNVDSPVTEWIEKNTEPDDVFLTPEWSMNRFLLSGRPMYYGWPYYAWSAGHDTNKRDTIYLWLISGCDGNINEFKRYCKERGIRYLIADPDFEDGDYGDDVFFNREFFEENLQQVAYFTEENTVIYKIY